MSKVQELIDHLKNTGKTDEEITVAVESLTKIALVKATDSILKFVSTSQEAAELEKITDDAEGQKKLAELYEKVTGQTFDQLANAKLEESAAEYLKTLLPQS